MLTENSRTTHTFTRASQERNGILIDFEFYLASLRWHFPMQSTTEIHTFLSLHTTLYYGIRVDVSLWLDKLFIVAMVTVEWWHVTRFFKIQYFWVSNREVFCLMVMLLPPCHTHRRTHQPLYHKLTTRRTRIFFCVTYL